jgi:hypothetical protein
MFLAGNVGFARLSLGFEGIEGLIETFLRRFARVDRAAND